MNHLIFAWTETTPPGGYPAYVNISRDENGKHMITVRSRGNGGRDAGTVEIPVEALESLLCELAADLYRDERADGLRGAASALERSEEQAWQPGAGSSGFTLPPPPATSGVAPSQAPGTVECVFCKQQMIDGSQCTKPTVAAVCDMRNAGVTAAPAPLTDEELAEKLRAPGTLTWGQCRNMVDALRAQGVVAYGVGGS